MGRIHPGYKIKNKNKLMYLDSNDLGVISAGVSNVVTSYKGLETSGIILVVCYNLNLLPFERHRKTVQPGFKRFFVCFYLCRRKQCGRL